MQHFRLNKSIVVTMLATLLACTAGLAQADGRGHRGGHGVQHGYAPRHFAYAPRRHYAPAYHHDHHDHHGRHALRTGLKVAAGAIIVGSIIHAINDDRRDRVVYRTRTVAPRDDYYYRIDPKGQCVEVTHNSRGQEVWTYVDPAYCN